MGRDGLQDQKKLEAGLGKGNISISGKIENSGEVKTDVSQRAQKIVNQIQMSELSNMINLIDEILDDDQKKIIITIDKLDENWIEDSLRYLMIKALIESTKDFKEVGNLKIIISLREDLLNRVYMKTRDVGFQKEKYESLCLHITWTRDELQELLDKRIGHLLKLKDRTADIGILSFLPTTINRYEKPLDYIIDRTLMRPRDAIQFLNSIIRRSDDKSQFTAQIIRDAEAEYSESRFNAIPDEWFTDYPNFEKASGLF